MGCGKVRIVRKRLRFRECLCYNGDMKRHMKVKTNKNNGQKVSSAIFLVLLGTVSLGAIGGGISWFSDEPALALTYQDTENVDFTINPTISVSLSGNLVIDDLVPGSSSDSNVIDVTVSTNASNGYYLAATVGASSTDTSLVNSGNSSYKFASLSSNAASLSAFSNNQWGYAYSTDGGTNWVSGNQGSTSAGYNGLPGDGGDSGATGVTLLNTSSPMVGGAVKFKIGAKAANDQAAGTYTNTVNFYAVTN